MTFIPWSLYEQILASMPIACVDVAILHDGKVLLVKRLDEPAKGQFWLPGGRVLKGEMLKDAAIRKTRDEVGIVCTAGPIVHTAETIFDDGPGGTKVHSINACFLMYPQSNDFAVATDDHHSDFIWVDSADPSLHDYVRRCLVASGLSF